MTRQIEELCRGLGFAAVGFAPARPTDFADEVRSWLRAGHHGTMEFLERDLAVRLDPTRILEGVKWFIMVGDQYAPRGDTGDSVREREGRIARYARGRDYHQVMKKRLHRMADTMRERFPGAEFRSFVDTAPVLEREVAALAGLGWQAKNTMLIHPRLGSYLLLGGAATTLDLEPPAEQALVADACGTCTRCIDACPTQAIKPYSVDGSRCVSYLTIERQGPIDPKFHAAMGDWIYGCDICQEVCPHNSARPDKRGESVLPAYQSDRGGFDLLEVLGWDAAGRREAFTSSAMKRAPLALMKRNALIAAGNALRRCEDAELLARVREISEDQNEPQLVRRTAVDVLRSLAGR